MPATFLILAAYRSGKSHNQSCASQTAMDVLFVQAFNEVSGLQINAGCFRNIWFDRLHSSS